MLSFLSTCSVFFLLCCFGHAGELSEETARFLEGLITAHTRDTSGTMSIVLRAEVDQPDPSEEEINRRIRQHEEIIHLAMQSISNEQVRNAYKHALATNAEVTRAQMIRNADFRLRGTYQRIGPYWGGDERWSVELQHPATEDSPVSVQILQRFLSPREVTCIVYDVRASTAIVSNTPTSLRIPVPVSLGRLPPAILNNLRTMLEANRPSATSSTAPHFEIAVSETTKDLYQLLLRSDTGVVAECDVEVTKDYVCRRVVLYDSQGQVLSRMECPEFFRSDPNGVWIAKRATITTFGITGSTATPDRSASPPTDTDQARSPSLAHPWILTMPARSRSPTTIIISVDENLSMATPNISKVPLTVTLPAGTGVIVKSATSKTSESFELTCPVEVTVDSAWELADHPCSHSRAPPADSGPIHVVYNPVAGWRLTLIVINILLLIGFFAIWMIKKGSRHSVFLLAATMAASLCAGCSSPTMLSVSDGSVPGTPSDNLPAILDVKPLNIDFGKLLSGSAEVTVPLRLTNSSRQRCEASFVAGCGCLRLSPTSATLDPGQRVDVMLTVDPDGRRGSFEQTVVIRITSDTAVSTVTVPVRGEVLRPVTARPDRLVLSVDDARSVAIGRVELAVPDIFREQLSAVCTDQRVERTLLTNGPDGIVYCDVTARAEGTAVYEPLSVLLHRETPCRVLTIPMFRAE